MTDTAKVLGQALPAAGVLTDVYTVPTATSAVVSTIKACNQSSLATKFRVSTAIAGAADTAAQYVYYDVPLAGNDSFSATEGWTLATTDVIRCRSDSGQVSFNIFGAQIT